MIIKNVKVYGEDYRKDIWIEDGVFKAIDFGIEKKGGQEVIDGSSFLALPPYIDSHCHLDYVATYGQPRFNETGTLFEGIDIWGDRSKEITGEDVKKRASRVLEWLVVQGTQAVRTHVNTDEKELVSMQAMLELKQEMKDLIDIQIIAFPQLGIYSYKNGLENLEEALKMGADGIGAIPHSEDTREDAVNSLHEIFKLAVKYDRLVDVHCDETDDEQSRGIEVVASEARKTGLGSRVTASHTTAMHSYNNAYTFKLFGLFKKANLNFVANPTINTHLQGRYDTYPKRRGVTRVKELTEAGLNVSFGNDDIMDPFYPLGCGDMLEVLEMGVHVCHLTGYSQMQKALDYITVNGAKTLNIEDKYGLEIGKPGNLILINSEDAYDIIRRHIKPTYSIRNGKIISQSENPKHIIIRGGIQKSVDFSI